MIVLGIVLILLSIFLAGWGIALWIGIGLDRRRRSPQHATERQRPTRPVLVTR